MEKKIDAMTRRLKRCFRRFLAHWTNLMLAHPVFNLVLMGLNIGFIKMVGSPVGKLIMSSLDRIWYRETYQWGGEGSSSAMAWWTQIEEDIHAIHESGIVGEILVDGNLAVRVLAVFAVLVAMVAVAYYLLVALATAENAIEKRAKKRKKCHHRSTKKVSQRRVAA